MSRTLADFVRESNRIEGSACANAWCPMIQNLRDQNTRLIAQRLQLARLAAGTPQFDNPLHVFEAQALRDRVLAKTTPSPIR